MTRSTQEIQIDALQHRIAVLNRDIKHLEYILNKAFTHSNGHQDGCLMGMMCQCGYMHWAARLEANKASPDRR